jgi:site-specific DNA-cytosine methylase
MKKILELFKGTGSITKYYKDKDAEVISLDILEKFEPTIISDIMEFDYKQFPVGYFDIIWASPECKVYSSMNIMNIGENQRYKTKEDLIKKQKEDSKFINKTIEIIEYLKPINYFIENPLNSQIWKYINNSEFINKFIVVDYCYFGTDYKKPTKILTDKELENKRCKCKKHPKVICWTNKKDKRINHNHLLEQKYSIPQNLLKYLLE